MKENNDHRQLRQIPEDVLLRRGECRSVIRTLREKHMEYRLNKYKEIEENTKIGIYMHKV